MNFHISLPSFGPNRAYGAYFRDKIVAGCARGGRAGCARGRGCGGRAAQETPRRHGGIAALTPRIPIQEHYLYPPNGDKREGISEMYFGDNSP